MPTRDEPWPVGTPCWTDAQVDDPARAADFYGRLFGWQAQDMGEAAGGYLMCSLNDRIVAGIGPKPAGVHMPSTWTTHFASDDVERSVRRLSGAAGRCVAGPVDVFTAGRAAMATDAAGAGFGIWQARDRIGLEVYNEPGSVCWSELHTGSYRQSQKFYADVFGWRYTEIGGDELTYSTFGVEGGPEAAGGIHLDEQKTGGTPNYWMTWFASADADATVHTAAELGSSVLMQPTDSPFGRIAAVRAPGGEVFGLIGARD